MINIPKEKSNKKRINGKFGIKFKLQHSNSGNQANPLNNFSNIEGPLFTKQQSGPNLQHILSEIGMQERGLYQDINLFGIFKFEKIGLLWKLWELVLTNQPLLIISDSPAECRLNILF